MPSFLAAAPSAASCSVAGAAAPFLVLAAAAAVAYPQQQLQVLRAAHQQAAVLLLLDLLSAIRLGLEKHLENHSTWHEAQGDLDFHHIPQKTYGIRYQQ